jgi:hypothetical protein
MSYQYDIVDFKLFLNNKNPKYRVDGLTFWQNRIPIPIDVFNRIFDESDQIVEDYVYQIVASVAVFSERDSFENSFNMSIANLPTDKLNHQLNNLNEWLNESTLALPKLVVVANEVAVTLGLDEFVFSIVKVSEALRHQGKKYARLYIPTQIRENISLFASSKAIGEDNTDMFGNIIADRYNIYRSGFSDALVIIFNALLEFRILCSGNGGYIKKYRMIETSVENTDVRFGRTRDGSLWEPGYDNDHYITLNTEHPMLRGLTEEQFGPLTEFLFFLGEYENGQFSDGNKKLLENLRQAISRSLWIKND